MNRGLTQSTRFSWRVGTARASAAASSGQNKCPSPCRWEEGQTKSSIHRQNPSFIKDITICAPHKEQLSVPAAGSHIPWHPPGAQTSQGLVESHRDAHGLSPARAVLSGAQAQFSHVSAAPHVGGCDTCCRWATPQALWSRPCGTEAALYLLISILITTAGTSFIKGNISLSQNANYWKNITHFKDFFTFYDVGLTPI